MKEKRFNMEGIKKMNKAIKILKDHVKKDINIDQIEILLHLADNEPDPISYSTLSRLMDNSTANISMNINILGEYFIKDQTNGDLIDTGLGLVKAFPSPHDSNENVVFLTAKGTKIVWMLNELIR
jgi:DNA-binding MarR family transcriptional regulator